MCGEIKTLPLDFFKKPPYMHPSGESYVALAIRTKGRPFNNLQWISENREYSHVLENLCYQNECQKADPKSLKYSFESLNNVLDSQSLQSVLNGDPFIETASFVLLGHKLSISTAISTVYFAYPRKDWDHYIENQVAFPSEKFGTECLVVEGDVCWKKNDELAIPFNKSSSSEGLGLGLVLVQKVTHAMNGELKLKCAPTTFSMTIRDLQ